MSTVNNLLYNIKCIGFLAFFFISTSIFAQNKVYFFVSEDCPISVYMAKEIKNAFDSFPNEFRFNVFFPKLNATQIAAKSFMEKYNLHQIPYQLDQQQIYATKYGIHVVPEVIVLDHLDHVLYKGRITNAFVAPGKLRRTGIEYDLLKALTLIWKGEEVPRPWPQPTGCFLTFQSDLHQE